jgi:cupin 2 domain-containing protein
MVQLRAVSCKFVDMKNNLFEGIPENAPEELFTDLLKADGVRIERIVSFGQSSPWGFWYDQEENEWVLLLEGSAMLEFDDGELVDLNPGDFVNIPAGRRHRVEKTRPKGRTVWLAVFYTASA